MAKQLKSSGQALDLVVALVVDDDGTVVDLVSGNTYSIYGTVGTGIASWKGTPLRYWSASANTGVDFNGIKYSGTLPLLNAVPGFGYFAAVAGHTTGSWVFSDPAANCALRLSSNRPFWFIASINILTATTPWSTSAPFSTAGNYRSGGSCELYYGLADDDELALDGSLATDPMGLSDRSLVSVGGQTGEGSTTTAFHCFYIFNSVRSQAQLDELHADPIGAVAESVGGGGGGKLWIPRRRTIPHLIGR